jgi:hypothetical protein
MEFGLNQSLGIPAQLPEAVVAVHSQQALWHLTVLANLIFVSNEA